MSTSTLLDTLAVSYYARVPVLLYGSAGIGKTAVIRGLAEALRVPCVTREAGHMDWVSANGIPQPRGGEFYSELPPQWFVELSQRGAGILFIDELTACSPSQQAGALSLILEGRIGRHKLPDKVWRTGAANPEEWSGLGVPLLPTITSRFLCLDMDRDQLRYPLEWWVQGLTKGTWPGYDKIPEAPPDPESWRAYARLVGGFLAAFPQYEDTTRKKNVDRSKPFPCRRTWYMLARAAGTATACLTEERLASAEWAIVSGLVGEEIGREFISWSEHANDYSAFVADPVKIVSQLLEGSSEEPTTRWWDLATALVAKAAKHSRRSNAFKEWWAAVGTLLQACPERVPYAWGAVIPTLCQHWNISPPAFLEEDWQRVQARCPKGE